MRRRRLAFLASSLALLTIVGGYALKRAYAEGIPASDTLTYAGVLTDANGLALSGSRTVKVQLWKQAAAGEEACPPATSSQPLVAGGFQVVLHADCTIAVHAYSDLWVEVTVDTSPMGRTKLGAVPYALEAQHASNASGKLAAALQDLGTRLGAVYASAPGGSPANAAASCSALLATGVSSSGSYWITNTAAADAAQAGKPVLAYCDQTTNGGGWALIANSVLSPNTLDFWSIPYTQRLGRRGQPSLEANFYDGSLYQTTVASYMDVIEDLQGKVAIALVATSSGINNTSMRFGGAAKVTGNDDIFQNQFAGGWSAPDYDGDTHASNCATMFNGVTQHYTGCWSYNFGSDADSDSVDGRFGPHLSRVSATALGLSNDGTDYTRVRRISRFVKW